MVILLVLSLSVAFFDILYALMERFPLAGEEEEFYVLKCWFVWNPSDFLQQFCQTVVSFNLLIAALIFSAGYYSSPIFLLIAALIFSAGYYSAPIFYNSKNLNCIGALSFFKICSHIFYDFWSQIGVVVLVTPKQEVERKSEWFCGVIFFSL